MDLTKTAVNRLAFGEGHELAPLGCCALAVTPGWLRSEMMLAGFGVSEDNWRDCIDRPESEGPAAPADFAVSETPTMIGRALAALAADPERQRWNQQSVTSFQLATHYDVTDLDGSRPDAWGFIVDVRERGLARSVDDYR